ncbi:MAG: complex I NDUFA9 subunit family protein [Robiginitomaculum sp.]|nr:MAG: complex I NDUFA9 subunit family protein [Robiginitomaculum sp.]
MRKLAVVFGGSGFLGRQVVRALCRDGWRVRVAVRRPHQAIELRVEGDVGQVQLVQTNIRSQISVAQAVEGAQIVINLVGVLIETGRQKFSSLHAIGAGSIAKAAAAVGASQMIHVSAIGADEQSKSSYARSKGKGERLVREAFASATILRPSVLFGPGDGLFERFAGLARMTPIIPVPGADTKMQPVYVGDVAKAVMAALDSSDAAAKTYELGGPETLTLGQIVAFTVEQIDRRRVILPVPDFFARILGFIGEMLGMLPFVDPFLTRDQVILLGKDNVVADDALALSDLGIKSLETVQAIVPSALVRFRRYGQFHEKRTA